MDMKLIVILIFGVLSLFLCLTSAIFTKTEKVKTFIALKGLASFSYVLLSLVACNLVFNMKAYILFIISGIVVFMFSNIVRAIPTRSDMFRTFYTFVEAIGFAFLTVSLFFMIEMPLIGLIAAAVAFIATMIVYLVLKKKDLKKDKLASLLLILTASLLLGISANFAIIFLTAQAFVFAGGAALLFAYVILQTFTSFTNKGCVIAKNILLGVGQICLALSIFFI